MVCRDFILPEICKPCLFFIHFLICAIYHTLSSKEILHPACSFLLQAASPIPCLETNPSLQINKRKPAIHWISMDCGFSVFCCRKRYMDSYLPCCLMACTVAPIASDRVSQLHSFQNLTVALFGFCFGSSMRIRLGNSEASPTAMASPISKMAISLQNFWYYRTAIF